MVTFWGNYEGISQCFAFCGAVVSVMLVKRISQRKKEMLAAEA
ncbi:hypothetical protein O5838_04365 [Escherichia coli]|nr:hypothetical protein [Escherichia coli]